MFILDVLALLTTTVAAAASTQNLMLAAVGSIVLPLLMIWLSQQRPPIAVAEATKAIGVFTKISLKNKVDDLMKQFRAHYLDRSKPTIAELRQSYDLLMMKVLSLLQDGDQKLASAVVSSRVVIWALLADEKQFAALHS